jgi:hypothetical protein
VSRRPGIAKLIMLASSAIATARASSAADWSQTLEANANAAYDTNPALIAGSKIADQSAQLTVDGNTTAQTELGQLTITPRFSITRYARETGLDYGTAAIDLAYQQNLERGQWTVTGQALTDSTVTSELGLTGITEINRRHDAETVSLGYQYLATERLSWQVQGSWQDTRYTDAQQFGLTDYRYQSLEFGPMWNLTDRVVGSLNLETDQISPQSAPAEKDYSAALQLKRALSEQYSWRVSAGATRVDTAGAYNSTSSVFELGASRQTERVQWDIAIRRSVLPIGLGLLAREDQAVVTVAARTSERSTLSLSVSVIRTDPVSLFLYLNPEISLSYLVYAGASWGAVNGEWRYNLSPHWALSLAFAQSRARNYNVADWANGNQARLGIVWQSGRL